MARNAANVNRLEATVKTCLKQGDREAAGRYVLELQRARQELAENQAQLQLHEQAYENNLLKIKHAGGNLARIRDKIARYDADLKMSSAEAEMARLAQEFHVDATTDFGKLESVIQERIDLNRAKVRVAVDLSGEGPRPSGRKRQPRASSPRMRSGNSNGKWARPRPRQRLPARAGPTRQPRPDPDSSSPESWIGGGREPFNITASTANTHGNG